MSVEIHKLSPRNWKPFAEEAHKVCFQEVLKPEWERIDFALLAWDTNTDKAIGYVTCREMNNEHLYWQYGGSFMQGSPKTFRGYEKFKEWSLKRYKTVSTRIENDNLPMLRLAMKVGFKITGVGYCNGSVMLHHEMEDQG